MLYVTTAQLNSIDLVESPVMADDLHIRTVVGAIPVYNRDVGRGC